MLIWIIFSLYFLPTIVAGARGHHNTGSIFILNLFLGWTFIGWIIALAIACSQVWPAKPVATSAVVHARLYVPEEHDETFIPQEHEDTWGGFIDARLDEFGGWFNRSSLRVRGGIILAVLGFVLAAIISSLLQPRTTSKSPSAESSVLPSPASGQIASSITDDVLEHIPGKPWALMGWSQANALTGYKQLWMVFDYYHSKQECLAGRRSQIKYDRGTELAVNDASSKCIQIGKEVPLEWKEMGWHVTKHRWIELDRFPTGAECEAAVRAFVNVSPDSKDKCVRIPVSAKLH
jgi:hypothetical protein